MGDTELAKYVSELEFTKFISDEKQKKFVDELIEFALSDKSAAELSNIIYGFTGCPPRVVAAGLKWVVFPLLNKGKRLTLSWVGKKIFTCKHFQKVLDCLMTKPSIRKLIEGKRYTDENGITLEEFSLLDVKDILASFAEDMDGNFGIVLDNIDGLRNEIQERISALKPKPPLRFKETSRDNPFVYSSMCIPYQKRSIEKQLDEIERFIDDGVGRKNFSWHVVSGEAGTGKSRFAWEVLKRYSLFGWSAGFLLKNNTTFDWSDWRPSNPTLIAIDYASENPEGVNDTILSLATSENQFEYPVRVVLIEREGQSSLEVDRGMSVWLGKVLGSGTGERQQIVECCFNPCCLSLNQVDKYEELIRDDLWEIMAYFFREGRVDLGQLDKDELLDEFFKIDDEKRPLFAAFFADAKIDSMDTLNWNKTRLIEHVIEKAKGKYWAPICRENLLKDMRLLAIATLVEKVDSSFDKLKGFPDDVCSTFRDIKKRGRAFESSFDRESLHAFVPDVVGELFVLRTLYDENDWIDEDHIATIMQILWGSYSSELANFFSRAWDDFGGDTRLKKLFAYEFIESKNIIGKMNWCVVATKASQNCEEFTEYFGKIEAFCLENHYEKLVVSLILAMLKNFKYSNREERRVYFKGFFGDLDRRIKEEISRDKLNCLNYSAYFGLHELLEYLCLDIDSDTLNSVDEENGAFPLLLASQNGHTDVVVQLLEHADVSVNQINEKNGTFPLLLASAKGHTDVVVQLLEHADISVNQIDEKNGAFPLLLASQEGHTDVVVQLLEHADVSVNQINEKNGAFPLLLASAKGHTDVVVQLLEHDGISVNQINEKSGAFPLLLASQEGHTDVVVQLLEHADVSVNQINEKNGAFPLLLASAKGHTDVVVQLLEHADISVNQIDEKNGAFPLLLASQEGHTDVVVQLLEHADVSVNQINEKNGAFPLLLASAKGHTDVVVQLLEHDGISVNQIDEKSGTFPLLLAFAKGHTKIVELLLEKGADPLMTISIEEKDLSILEVAREMGHTEIVNLLERYIDSEPKI